MAVELRLKGVPPRRWMTRRRMMQIGTLVLVTVVLLVLLVVLRSLVVRLVMLGVMLAVVVCGYLVLQPSDDGVIRLLRIGMRVRSWLSRVGNLDGYDPSEDPSPWLVPAHRLVGVAQVDGGDEVAVLDYGGAFVCVLEVSGDGEGVRSAYETTRLAQRDTLLHRALSARGMCVDQVDWVTLIRPLELEPVLVGVQETMAAAAPNAPERVQRSVVEAAALTAYESVSIRSWAVVRFNADALYDHVAEPPFTRDSGVEAAFDALLRVQRALSDAGYSVLDALSPRKYAALTRALLDPARDPDDLTGCSDEDMWRSMPAWSRPEKGSSRGATIRSISATDDGPWFHATAAFSRPDLPDEAVDSRWLEAFVNDPDMRRTPRALVSQIGLLPQYEARRIAQSQKTTAAGRRYKLYRDGNVNVEEAEESETAASEVAGDIVRRGEAGIVPSVRVCISASTARDLRHQREHVDALVQSMGAHAITWDDARPGPGLLRVLPLGLEVQR